MNFLERLVSLEEALHIVDNTLGISRRAGETLPVRNSLARVLISDQRSRLDLPTFDRSAVDGFAVLSGDECDEYEVLETVRAGNVGTTPLRPGGAVKVMTGAPVPDGTDRVIMLEDAEEQGGVVRITRKSKAANIRKMGEDIRAGDLLLSAGTTLGPLEIANLIACGISEVEVAVPVRVSILSTGDEIVDSFDKLSAGKIIDSNGPMLAALATDHGLDVVGEESLPDDRKMIRDAILAAIRRSEITIVTGGVSVGECDFVLGAMGDVGLDVHFSRIAVQPGKPTVYATTPDGAAVFGLPGNPVAAFLMFHLFVLRVADRMIGKAVERAEFRLPLAREFKRGKAERLSFVPARLTSTCGVEPVAYHGSAHLSALLAADGFMKVPQGVAAIRQGDEVTFFPIMFSRWGR